MLIYLSPYPRLPLGNNRPTKITFCSFPLLKGYILQEGCPVRSEELYRMVNTVRYFGTDTDSVGVFIFYGSESFGVMLRV